MQYIPKKKNRISIDIPTFIKSTRNSLSYYLIHELLHSIGFNEDDVLLLTEPYYIKFKQHIDIISDEIKEKILSVEKYFRESVKNVRIKNTELFYTLLDLAKKQSENGFPSVPEKEIKVVLSMREIGCYKNIEVIFM